MVVLIIFNGVGKKENEKKSCKRKFNSFWVVVNYGNRVEVEIFNEELEDLFFYEVVFIVDIKVIICYGCKGYVWNIVFDLFFFVLYNIFLWYKEYRVFKCCGEMKIRISKILEYVYYYFLCLCVLLVLSMNIKLEELVVIRLLDLNK